jgi:hypothetical protein
MTRILQSTLFKRFPQLIRQIDVLLIAILPIAPPPFATLTAAILPTATLPTAFPLFAFQAGVFLTIVTLPAAVPSAVFPAIAILPVVALPSGVIQLRYCQLLFNRQQFYQLLFVSCVHKLCF